MIDHSTNKLGLVHTSERPGASRLSDIANPKALQEPTAAEVNYHAGLTLGNALGNDTFGCCVEAGMYRMAQMRTHAAQGSAYTPVTPPVLALYTALTGFNRSVPSTDNGTQVAPAMQYWAKQGLDLGLQAPDVQWPHITANVAKIVEVKNAIDWFGGLGFSFALPNYVKTSLEWDISSAAPVDSAAGRPGGWGMHFAPSGRFDGRYFYIITWGIEVAITPAFLAVYAVAADTGLSKLWRSTSGKSPFGLNFDQLRTIAANPAARLQ